MTDKTTVPGTINFLNRRRDDASNVHTRLHEFEAFKSFKDGTHSGVEHQNALNTFHAHSGRDSQLLF